MVVVILGSLAGRAVLPQFSISVELLTPKGGNPRHGCSRAAYVARIIALILLSAAACQSAMVSAGIATDTEHNDRKARFQQLSTQTLRGTPTFYEYLVKKSDVPSLPADTAVLRVVFEERVFFETALSDVRPDAIAVLNIVAEALRNEPAGTVLFVAGHADSRGGTDYNLDLSVRRATSVAEELQKRGVGSVKIWRVGFGKAVPLRPNDSPANMAVNRRVEFIVASRFDAAADILRKPGKFLCKDERGTTPEVCRNPESIQGSFPATPIRPQIAKPNGQSLVPSPPTAEQPFSSAEDRPVIIDLNPPTKTVGAPTR